MTSSIPSRGRPETTSESLAANLPDDVLSTLPHHIRRQPTSKEGFRVQQADERFDIRKNLLAWRLVNRHWAECFWEVCISSYKVTGESWGTLLVPPPPESFKFTPARVQHLQILPEEQLWTLPNAFSERKIASTARELEALRHVLCVFRSDHFCQFFLSTFFSESSLGERIKTVELSGLERTYSLDTKWVIAWLENLPHLRSLGLHTFNIEGRIRKQSHKSHLVHLLLDDIILENSTVVIEELLQLTPNLHHVDFREIQIRRHDRNYHLFPVRDPRSVLEPLASHLQSLTWHYASSGLGWPTEDGNSSDVSPVFNSISSLTLYFDQKPWTGSRESLTKLWSSECVPNVQTLTIHAGHSRKAVDYVTDTIVPSVAETTTRLVVTFLGPAQATGVLEAKRIASTLVATARARLPEGTVDLTLWVGAREVAPLRRVWYPGSTLAADC